MRNLIQCMQRSATAKVATPICLDVLRAHGSNRFAGSSSIVLSTDNPVLFSFTVIAFTFLFIWCVLPTDSSPLVGHEMSKRVSFKDPCEVLLPSEENDSSSSEDFYEITTSEAESISSSEKRIHSW